MTEQKTLDKDAKDVKDAKDAKDRKDAKDVKDELSALEKKKQEAEGFEPLGKCEFGYGR